ncbi:MAG: hypothetical protein HDS66_00130 [Bacteroidales bacterium]|nr:hypothetical protein [Bacteroidales bacterium]
MKEQDTTLTLKEIELLCSQYLNCRLSVLEEAELEYVLGTVAYTSPIIDDTRLLMGLATASASKQPAARLQPAESKPKRSWKMRYLLEGAAALTLLLGVGFSLTTPHNSEEEVYIAYSDGKKLDATQSRLQAEEDMKRAEEMMAYVSNLEAREQQKITKLINLTQSQQ